MLIIDELYFLNVVFVAVFLLAAWTKRSSWHGLLLLGVVLFFTWFTGYYSGSAYHPCQNPRYTRGGVVCDWDRKLGPTASTSQAIRMRQ